MEEKKYDLLAFTDKGLSLDVRVDPDEDTVWLTKDQMAELFDRDRSVISRHISNIFKEKELNETATRAKNAQVQMEGGRAVTRISEFFNLDVIISVGYRVKSTRGVMFRKWASSVLKQYLIKGYAVDSYADSKLLSLFNHAKQGVTLSLVKGPHSRLSQDDLDAFLLQHGPISVRESDDFHDRFAFVDDCCYHVGASFNHMGKRAFAVMKMEDGKAIRQLRERIDDL